MQYIHKTNTLNELLHYNRPSKQGQVSSPKGINYTSSLDYLLPESYLNLPLSDLNAVQTGLSSYLLTLSTLKDALTNFTQKKYREFDALVGNNSCYLVSYLIFILSKKIENNEQFYDECIKLIKKIKIIKTKTIKKYNEIKNTKINTQQTLLHFLNENDLSFELDIDYVYLCLSFGCTISKKKNNREYTEINYDQLLEKYKYTNDIPLRKKSVITLVKHWQKGISQINVDTIQKHIQYIPEKEKEWSNYLFDNYILKDERGRLCTPSLYTLRVIYNLLLTIPRAYIGFQINIIEEPKQYMGRFTLYYEVQNSGNLVLTTQENIPADHAIYMFTGCRYIPANSPKDADLKEIEKTFKTRNIKDLIFAHEVTYPQYPKSLNIKSINPNEQSILEEIDRLKKFQGFSLENPSDVCLAHIFIDNTTDQMQSSNDPPLFLPNFQHI